MKKLTAEDKKKMKERFDYYDKNHNGSVSRTECEKILKEYMSEDEIKDFFARADRNKDGKISFSEFEKI